MAVTSQLLTASDLLRMPEDGWRHELVRGELHTSFDPESYFPGAPDLVVEVVSPSDSYTKVQEKVLLWLRSGARCVVIADPERQLFVVHRPQTEPIILTADDTLTVPDVVPGWEFRVGDAFPPK